MKLKRVSISLLASVLLSTAACAVDTGSAPEAEPEATTPPTATAKSPVLGPRRQDIPVIVAAVAAETIYDTIVDLGNLFGEGAAAQAQIIADLAQLKAYMVQQDALLVNLYSELKNLTYVTEQASFLATTQQIQALEAQADSAREALAEWQQGGMTNASLLATADSFSLQAANTLKDSSLYYRPGETAGAPLIFDARLAIASYLYALTVRLAVIAAEQPDYRKMSAYNEELQQHVTCLNTIPGLARTDIYKWNTLSSASELPNFMVCSYAEDTNTGYKSIINGGEATSSNPYCMNWISGTAVVAGDAFNAITFYDNWHVEDELGIHAVEKMAAFIQSQAEPSQIILHLPTSYNSLGPLVSGIGGCLDATPSSLSLAACKSGTASETFQTGNINVSAPIALADDSICIEQSLWNVAWWPYGEVCSGSAYENYIISSTNQLHWAENTNYCLQANGIGLDLGLVPCVAGAANQTWTRSWPTIIIKFPPVIAE